MVGRDQYGYIKGPYYMVKPGPKPPGEHNKVESKKLHELGRFPKLRAARRAAGATGAVGKAFSVVHATCREFGGGGGGLWGRFLRAAGAVGKS